MTTLQKMIMALDEERMRTEFGTPLYNTLTNVINELIDARDNAEEAKQDDPQEMFKFVGNS